MRQKGCRRRLGWRRCRGLGNWLESQRVHSENRGVVFGLVWGYGAVQSIWEYSDGLGETDFVLRYFALDVNDLGG